MGIQGKLISWLAIALLLVAGLAACGSDDSTGSDGDLDIVASTTIVSALVQEVAGEGVSITTIIDSGADPHTFELTPGDVSSVTEADIAFIVGLEYDDFLLDDLDGPEVFVLSEGIELLEAGEHGDHDDEDLHSESESDKDHDDEHHEHDDHQEESAGDGEEQEEGEEHQDEHEGHDDHDHGEFDPHVWQDPIRVQVMVDNIAEALAELNPDQADDYRSNADVYNQTLDETHAEIKDLIDMIPANDRLLVTNHDAFAYFADRYGLQVVGTVIPGTSSEADPSAGEIAELIEIIEHQGIGAIFAEDLIDPKVAEAVAADADVEIVYGLYSEQVGEAGSDAETVHGMLFANATKISEALR